MSAQFGLFLGEDRIPVINWINRHGSPEGRKLRFTVPTEVKAKLEANRDATFRLERDGQQWDFELLSLTQHGTGTNGVPATGRVKTKEGGSATVKTKAAAKPQKKPTTGVGIPKLDGDSEAKKDGDFKREKSSLKELLLKKKAERKAEKEASEASEAVDDADADEPKTVEGLPTSADPGDDSPGGDEVDDATVRGMPPVDGDEEE